MGTNWNQHFRVRSNSKGTSVFGTINGAHTIHELSDLLDVFQYKVDSLRKAYETSRDDWQNADFMGFPAWEKDWQTFLARYQPVADWTRARIADGKKSGTAETALSAASMVFHPLSALGIQGNQPWDVNTDEPAYQHLLSVFKPYDGDPTSFDDLDRRFQLASMKWKEIKPPDYSKMPQPTAQDADFTAYKGADTAYQATTSVLPPLPFGPPMPLWKKVAWGALALAGLGMVIRISTGRIL
jgi:hypothetical protein